mgnify:CR=1 FL=1
MDIDELKKLKKINYNGYVAYYMPQHHRAFSNGCVYEHIIMAEQKIGRLLMPEEVVHHVDHNKKNNSLDNLMVFATTADHNAFHGGSICYITDNGAYKCDRKENRCIDCNVLICSTSKRCHYCSSKYRQQNLIKMFNRPELPDRNTLKSKIRNSSFVSIGLEYGVTDNRVRKWCKKFNLPYRSSEIKLYNDDDWERI